MNKQLQRSPMSLLGPIDADGNELQSSFTTLFGPIDHADGNEARSVLSPSAYLVDLLQLRDSQIGDFTDYHARRPDVRSIHLDQANTFTEIPFLDVCLL